MPKLIGNWKKHLLSYSALSLFANVLIAVAYGLSFAFGAGIVYLSPFWIVVVMGTIAVMGAVGKFIKQFDEDEKND